MSEAELLELINKKRNELEEKRSGNVGVDVLEKLEDEIEKLEASLSSNEPNAVDPQVFVDECAG
jgi:hypothetical protein